MRKVIEVSNCFDTGTRFNMGVELEIVQAKKHHDRDRVELENGIWLQGYGDGRYITEGDELQRWAGVWLQEKDDGGEYHEGTLLGYTRV